MSRDWEVDNAGVLVARARLNIARPVRVKVTGQRKTAGRYKGIAGGVHEVTLSTYLSVEEAGETLWHELAHAAQREGYGSHGEWMAAYDTTALMEANAEAAERLNERFPLCRLR
jgi:hypothetical protein